MKHMEEILERKKVSSSSAYHFHLASSRKHICVRLPTCPYLTTHHFLTCSTPLSTIMIAGLFFLTISIPVALAHHHHRGLSSSRQSEQRVSHVDLSYSIGNSTIFYPGSKGYTLTRDQEGYKNNGEFWYSSFSFCMGEHGGTHLDAPYHFNKNGWTVDQIPSHHLINVPAVVINVERELERLGNGSGSFLLTVEHLINFEKALSPIPSGGVVLIYTGWSKYWPNRNIYLGIKNGTTDDSLTLNFPGISEEAIKWLVEERQIVGVGIDTPSVDQGTNQHYPVHVYAASNQIYNLENVANLHLLLHAKEINLFVLPLKILGGTGAPARILAAVKK